MQDPSQYDVMAQRHEMHLTRMMAVIFLVFALSYFPCTITSMIDWNTILSKNFHIFCQITVYIGSGVNPIIYGLMNTQFRDSYFRLIRCQLASKLKHSIVKKTTAHYNKVFVGEPLDKTESCCTSSESLKKDSSEHVTQPLSLQEVLGRATETAV